MINFSTQFRNWQCLAICAVVALFVPPNANAIDTKAKQAYLIDVATGSVLYEKNADQPIPPASMSKLMTIYMVFELLKDGGLSLEDKFLVSKKAWRKGGSKMFVKVNSQVRVDDLLRGIIVQSGNDSIEPLNVIDLQNCFILRGIRYDTRDDNRFQPINLD